MFMSSAGFELRRQRIHPPVPKTIMTAPHEFKQKSGWDEALKRLKR
jgi:hypothetical protein